MILNTGDCLLALKRRLEQADAVVIGAGSGLSAAAGLTYAGRRFEDHFREFIERYGMRDMYSAGFYPFPTQEEKWAYWSRHIYYNRYDMPAAKLYRDLYAMMKDKNHFVLTTSSGWPVFRTSVYLQPRETTGCSSANRHAIRNCMTMRRRSGPC